MPPEQSKLTWDYEPADYFEAPLEVDHGSARIFVDEGRVVATLREPSDPIPEAAKSSLRTTVETIFRTRQALTHRSYSLAGPRLEQHLSDGSVQKTLTVSASSMVGFSDHADLVVRDSDGNVKVDSRAERIQRHRRLIIAAAQATEDDPILRRVLESYGAAVDDSANELVHLYEIRDALADHYGTERVAWTRLGVSRSNWRRLGELANSEPLYQGRHRGRHASELRDASPDELAEARSIAQELIRAYIDAS